VLRSKVAGEEGDGAQSHRSIAALDSSIRQVDRLVRDFTDYSAPVTMDRKPIDIAEVLSTSLEVAGSACCRQKDQPVDRTHARTLAEQRRLPRDAGKLLITSCVTLWKRNPTAVRFT